MTKSIPLPHFSRSRLSMNALALAALVSISSIATAQSQVQAGARPVPSSAFQQFSPTDAPTIQSIDYSVWDEAMNYLVFRMGKSLRKGANRPDPSLGSRRTYGHVSRYRLEGNRVIFSFLTPEVIASFTEYRQDLERTAGAVNIANLPRNEQLAFWINLHNVSVIEQIALAWPVRQPSTLKVGEVPLDEAKFITVQGISMSPKDIRTQIIYPNWQDPRVIYGFWRGDIGSPSIQAEAFNSENVERLLNKGAVDFVNSLRGTQKSGSTLQVSKIYDEAAPFYFRNFDTDLRTHIANHAQEDVTDILGTTQKIDASIYEADIADMAGGAREPSYSNITTNGTSTSFRIPQSMARLLVEHERKVELIIREGRTGTVTFNNIDLPGEEPKAKEIK